MTGQSEGMEDDELRGDAVLRLPVRARGIELGHPIDLILDLAGGRAVGLNVFCGDRRQRFLPLAAASIEDDTISITSALILLDDLGAQFYRDRADALAGLRGQMVEQGGRRLGRLVDVVMGRDGRLRSLLVKGPAAEIAVPLADGPVLAPV